MIDEPILSAGHPGPYGFTIRGTDTDLEDRLHLFALLSYMQEAAFFNAEAGGLGTTFLDGQGLCWILIRIAVRLDWLPHWGDRVIVNTWNRGCRRLTWIRDFTFSDRQGNGFGVASSEWIIADKSNHRPQKPDILPASFSIAQFDERAIPEEIRGLPRLEIRPGDKPVLTQFADFSDIDRNGHVNNTRYAAWCMNALHAFAGGRVAGCRVSELDIHFVSEVRQGDKLVFYCQQIEDQIPGGLYRVESRRESTEDQVVFRADVRLIPARGDLNFEQL